MASMLPVAGFDVRAYTRSSARVDRSMVDTAAFRERPLDPDAARALAYLRSVERSAVGHLRDVLVIPSHTDPRVTVFLTTLAYGEYWFGDALTAILDVHPEPGRRSRFRHGHGHGPDRDRAAAPRGDRDR